MESTMYALPDFRLEEDEFELSYGSSISQNSSISQYSSGSFDSGYAPSPKRHDEKSAAPLTGRIRAVKQYRCRHDGCSSSAFAKSSERNAHETVCGGFVCKGRRYGRSKRYNNSGIGNSKEFPDTAGSQQVSTSNYDTIPEYGRSITSEGERAGMKVNQHHQSMAPLLSEDVKSSLAKSPLSKSPEMQPSGNPSHSSLQHPHLPLENRSVREGPGANTAAPSETSLEASPSEDENSSHTSLDLKTYTEISSEKKREIIEKVMGTFDEMFLRSPVSWYSDGLEEEEEDNLDTEYDTDSDLLSCSQRSLDVWESPEAGGYTVVRDNDAHDDEPQDGEKQGTVQTSDRSQAPPEEPTARRISAVRDGKRKIDDSRSPDDDDGEDYDDRRKRRRTPEQSSQTASSRGRFACPYTKRYPGRTPKAVSCVFPGYRNVARLKGHLYRTHMRPITCLRCYDTFRDEEALGAHHNAAERCVQPPAIPKIEGITPEQEKKLKSKKRIEKDSSEEKRWEAIYLILFQGETDIPSPYCDFDPQSQYSQMSPGSANLMAFEQFSREHSREIVRRRLVMQIEREGIRVEERLRSMMFDTLRMAQEDMLNQWRNSINSCLDNSQDTSESREEQTDVVALAESSRQYSAEGNILNLVQPPPPTDHVDARKSLAEVPIVNKPCPADSGFFSFDASSSTSEQPEQAPGPPLDIQGTDLSLQQLRNSLDHDDQPSPTVADDSQPVDFGIFEGIETLDSDFPHELIDIADPFRDSLDSYIGGNKFDFT